MPFRVKSGGGDADKYFYPDENTPLENVTAVEGNSMRVLPIDGTDYYPYIYLVATVSGSAVKTAEGKYFSPVEGSYSVTPYVNLINAETGESLTGYPKAITNMWSAGINAGGYCRIKCWTINASKQISVTTQRWNTNYTKVFEDTNVSASVTGDAVDAYISATKFKIETDADNPYGNIE